MTRRYLFAAFAILPTAITIAALMQQADMKIVLLLSVFAGGFWGKFLAKNPPPEQGARGHAWDVSFPAIFLVACAVVYLDGQTDAASSIAFVYTAITLMLVLVGRPGSAFRLSGDERYRKSQQNAALLAQRVLVLGVGGLALAHLGQFATLDPGIALFMMLALHEASYHAAMWWQERGADG